MSSIWLRTLIKSITSAARNAREFLMPIRIGDSRLSILWVFQCLIPKIKQLNFTVKTAAGQEKKRRLRR